MMRNLNRSFAILFLMTISACGTKTTIEFSDAPDWSLQTADQQTFDFSVEKHGKTHILFFWASWCPYCKALMPHLQSIRHEYGDSIEILAISIKDDKDPVEILTNLGFDFRPLANGDPVAELHEISGTPGLIVVDSQGKIRFDLRDIQIVAEKNAETLSHRQKATRRAPFWAAALRKALDDVQLRDSG